ncbi:MAG: DUF302 domain-containing protein [Bryobacteraceae bacterium]|jgi:uncharacterized protein (DUF302 family)
MPDTNGMISIESRYSVDATVERLRGILDAGGVKIFAIVDHSGEAEKAGIEMRNTKLAIFGNPKGGTPLMLASPTAALDLPLKILVWEDAGGKVRLTYNSAEYIAERHHLPAELTANIAVIDKIAAKAAG